MQFSTATLLTLLGAASAQKVWVISVGSPNGSLTFSPDNVKAEVGDMMQFQFRGGNHSVVQSNFDNPCTPISQTTNQTGVFSGYQPVAASAAMGMIPTYTMMVTAKTPMWFYCSQAKHCQNGMVMVVNENTAANASRSLTAFKDLAKAATANIAPSTATGGSTNGTTSGSTGSTGSSNSGSGTSSGSGSADASQSSSPAGSDVATAGASVVGISASMGLIGVVAALFML